MRFMKFQEDNQWEGEIWYSWLQVDGNEDELDNLEYLLRQLEETDEDVEYQLSSRG